MTTEKEVPEKKCCEYLTTFIKDENIKLTEKIQAFVKHMDCHQGESEKSEEVKTTHLRIGMLRQWLNEDRITDDKKMVTSEDIRYWLGL